MPLQQNLDIHRELIVDLFAGGGGMSEGIRMASGRNPDIAINHNDDALSMHRANHPDTRHFVADVFEVCPRTVTHGRPVGHLHASPDCTHHSQAAGGQPRNERRRALSWVVIRWAGQVKPRVITLENVHQVTQWGPLIAKRDKATGRVLKLDGSVAARGERVPREFQYLIPDPKRKGRTWQRFVQLLRGMGYVVEYQRMVAADYGAGTTRDRLFLHARNDGRPVQFPPPTHSKTPGKGQKPWRAAHEFIDWSLPGKSIFDRPKPLAEATLRRIAKGVQRFVIDAAEPFIVSIANWSRDGTRSASAPLNTITAWPRGGHHAVVAPVLAGVGGRAGQTEPRAGNEPLYTITSKADAGLVTAYMMQANGGFNTTPGHDLRDPTSTITNTGSQQQLVTAHLAHLRGNCDARDITDPVMTISAGGQHHALVECTLSQERTESALRVAAFMINYYGNGCARDLCEPLDTVTTRDRLALVTVWVKDTPFVIVDIMLRMLAPHELYAAQGFPQSYIIDHGHDGRVFSKSEQVRMVGNSVSPYPAAALFRECHRGDDIRLVA